MDARAEAGRGAGLDCEVPASASYETTDAQGPEDHQRQGGLGGSSPMRAKACKMRGGGRDSSFRFKQLHDPCDKLGRGALALQEISRQKPIPANRSAPQIAARASEGFHMKPRYGTAAIYFKDMLETRHLPPHEGCREGGPIQATLPMSIAPDFSGSSIKKR